MVYPLFIFLCDLEVKDIDVLFPIHKVCNGIQDSGGSTSGIQFRVVGMISMLEGRPHAGNEVETESICCDVVW